LKEISPFGLASFTSPNLESDLSIRRNPN